MAIARKILGRAILAVAILIPATTLVGLYLPKVRLGALYVAGRCRGCPYAEVMTSFDESNRKFQHHQHVEANITRIETDRDLALWDTPMGSFWAPLRTNPTMIVSEQLYGVYDRFDLGVRPGDVVLDCGANIGLFTRRALDKGATKVVAIEPVPENLECLRRNFKPEIESGKVVIVPKGVWNKEDQLPMYSGENSAIDSFAWRWHDDAEARTLSVTTIDLIVAELGLDQVDFVKMDIEGSEPNAIQGGAGTLQRFTPRIVFDSDNDHPNEFTTLVTAVNPAYVPRIGPCMDVGSVVYPAAVYFY